MHERPLKHLRLLKAAGLDELLARLESARVRIGVLSDYPAARKLQALDLAGRFSPVLCSTDPAIDALKPHPRGFLHACAQWSLAPAEVLMVGDRADADAAGASASGMPCVLISHGRGVAARSPGMPRASVPSKGCSMSSTSRPAGVPAMTRSAGGLIRPYLQIARVDHWFKNAFMLLGVLLALFYHPEVASSRACCRLRWRCCPPASWRRATTC